MEPFPPDDGYDPGTPHDPGWSEADIKAHTNFELLLAFPRWESDDDVWLAFRREADRLNDRVGNFAIRSYLFTTGSLGVPRKLGIFIRHDAIPPGGIGDLF